MLARYERVMSMAGRGAWRGIDTRLLCITKNNTHGAVNWRCIVQRY